MKRIKKMLLCMMFLMTVVMIVPAKADAAVKISKTKTTLIKGQTTTLKITGTKKKVTWSSSKKTVVTVSSKGKVTAKKKGTAKITAKVGGKKFTCKVTVETPSLSKTKLSLTVGKKFTLKVSGTSQKVTWKSSKKSVATVSSSGKVTAKKKGTAKITAIVGGKKYTCKVTVVKKTPQDEILKKITKNFIVGSYHASNWENALICTFKNNSEYDLSFEVTVDFYDSQNDWVGAAWQTQGYFQKGTETVMVFDGIDFDKYKIKYSIKKTPDSVKALYDKISFTTTKKSYGIINYALNCSSSYNFMFNGLVVYYNSAGKIIDYDTTYWSASEGFEGEFNLPVNKNLDTVSYAYYKTFYQLESY